MRWRFCQDVKAIDQVNKALELWFEKEHADLFKVRGEGKEE